MKFTSYIIRLNHDSPGFSGKIIKNDYLLEANFVKIKEDIYIIHFKNQYEFEFFERIKLNSSNEDLVFLSPVLSKYNKRKLGRIYSLFKDVTAEDGKSVLIGLLAIENFLRCRPLLDFFKIDEESFIAYLLENEIKNIIKIIDVNKLYIVSYEDYISYLNELKQFIIGKYNKRVKYFKLSEIESKLKIPKESVFFKYLLTSLKEDLSFTVANQRLSFTKLALLPSDIKNIETIEKEIKAKTGVFSIEEMIKRTFFSYSIVNNSIWHLIEEEKVVQLNERFFIDKSELTKVINKLKKFKRNQGDIISIKLFRELTNYTRKNIIIIMEYLDKERITQRIEDNRKILLPV